MKSFLFFAVALFSSIVAGGMATPQDLDDQIAKAEKELVDLKAKKEAPKVEQSAEFREVAAGDRFHFQVLKAARKQMREGKLTRLKFLQIKTAMISPAFRKRAEDLAKLQMKASGSSIETFDFSNIDWDKLIEFVEKLIPLILQLIDAFAVTNPAAAIGAYA